MICNKKLTLAVSNLGWIDKGSLWIYDNKESNSKTVSLSEAKYLSIFGGLNDYFSICHNYEDTRFDISIHHFRNPETKLCKLSFDNFKTQIEGDKRLIKLIPQFYLARLQIHDTCKSHFISVQEDRLVIDDSKIDWYNNGNFDFEYQGLIGVTEYNDELLFSVQRDGSIYRISKETNQLTAKIDLAHKYGNPKVIFNKDNSLLITDDYDTIFLINPKDWSIIKQSALQEPENGTGLFIGSYYLNEGKDLIIIARPFSSDVIMLDKNLKIKHFCKIGRQPLEAVVLDKNKVIARDWKTGDLLIGKMTKKFFA
jgi:hypothetical protein